MKNLSLLATRCTLFSAIMLIVTPAQAQLRIVDYNTAVGPRAGMETVLQAIGQEIVNGFAKPIDVLAVQEQSSSATTTQAIVDVLNGLYGASTYARATLDGGTSGAGRPGLIYNTTSIELIDQDAFGMVGTSAQARQTLRYQLRPVGYDSTADFYVYSNHYKAGTSGSDEDRRDVEAAALRANLDALGQGTHSILAGDYNIQSSSEAMYQTLLSPGAGQAFDPANRPGNWHDSGAFRDVHTQAPAVNPPGSLIGGGMDDRFDFQLVTGEFLDSEGLDYIVGSYRAFGNNGTHTLNGDISSGTGAAPAVLSALMTTSDHLPVVADYQLPAVMQAVVGMIPETLSVGQAFQLAVTVNNAAAVLVPLGADELDYTVTASGDLFGMYSATDAALGAGNEHLITFDTSTPGTRSGMITVSSTSQGVANGLIEIPISFEVIIGQLQGDYNGDGLVDAADYVVWRNNVDAMVDPYSGADGDGSGIIDGGDYAVWRANFGNTSSSGTALIAANRSSAAVPESPTLVLLIFAAIFFSHGRERLQTR